MSFHVVFDNVIVLSKISVAVTPPASWFISVTKFSKLVWTDITLVLTVKVLLIVKEFFAAEVSLLKPVAVAPWLFELALIAVTKAVAVLFPDDKLSVKFAAKAFWELIFISLAPRLLLF